MDEGGGASNRSRTASLLELAALTLLIGSYIWLWDDAFRRDGTVLAALLLGLILTGHLRRRETLRDVGVRYDNLLPAAAQAIVVVLPIVALTVLFGLALGSVRIPPAGGRLQGFLGVVVWGSLQQFLLLAFLYRRLDEVVGRPAWAMGLAAALFGFFHLPNPFLTIVTIALGALSCLLYRRVPNVLVLGLSHAVVSIALNHSLPRAVTAGLRVGPGYWAG